MFKTHDFYFMNTDMASIKSLRLDTGVAAVQAENVI